MVETGTGATESGGERTASRRSQRILEGGVPAVAVLLYAAICSAAIETFLAGSSARWLVLVCAALYGAGSYLAWRHLRWATRAAASFFALWLLLGLSLWMGPGSEIVLVGSPTPVLLSVFTLAGVALAGVLLALAGALPVWARSAGGVLGAYGVLAFALGVAARTPYARLLAGESFGPPDPVAFLQGAVIGALLVVPAALLFEIYRGTTSVRGSAWRPWATRFATLACCLALALYTVAGGGTPDTAPRSAATASAAPVAPVVPAPPPPTPVAAATPPPPQAQPEETRPTVEEELGFTPVADFSIPSVQGNELVRLSDRHDGKVIVVNWARSDCGWSKRQMPELAKRYQSWRDEGLEIIGIQDEFASSMAELDGFLAQSGPWPVGLYDQAEFAREIRPMGSGATPETYVISRRGKVEYVGLYRGDEYWTKLDAAVRAALDEPAPTRSYVRPRELAVAPPFELPDLDGNTVRLADYAGGPLVVEFFRKSTCDWSGRLLAELQREYGSRGLRFVAINLFNEDADIQACLAKRGTTYPVLRGTREVQSAWTGGPKGWAVFFVTPEGRIFKQVVNGYSSDGNEAVVYRKLADALVAGTYQASSAGGNTFAGLLD